MKSTTASAVRKTTRIPKAWTLTEAACLLDLPAQRLYQMIRKGEVRAFKLTYWRRPPGTPVAYRRVRLMVSTEALEAFMRERERLTALAYGLPAHEPRIPLDDEGRRRYYREAQARSRARRRGVATPEDITGRRGALSGAATEKEA